MIITSIKHIIMITIIKVLFIKKSINNRNSNDSNVLLLDFLDNFLQSTNSGLLKNSKTFRCSVAKG